MNVGDLRSNCIIEQCVSNSDRKCSKTEEEFLDSRCPFLNWLAGSEMNARETIEALSNWSWVK